MIRARLTLADGTTPGAMRYGAINILACIAQGCRIVNDPLNLIPDEWAEHMVDNLVAFTRGDYVVRNKTGEFGQVADVRIGCGVAINMGDRHLPHHEYRFATDEELENYFQECEANHDKELHDMPVEAHQPRPKQRGRPKKARDKYAQ